jgi:hypothetical protein
MKSTRCYLCGGQLHAIVRSSYGFVPLTDSRHAPCFRKLAKATRKQEVQHGLRACAEPSFAADDEVSSHMMLAFRRRFIGFLAPGPGTISTLPTELQHMIADSCYESGFANLLRLANVKQYSQVLPSAARQVPVSLLDAVFVGYSEVDGIRYITSLTNANCSGAPQALHLDATDWTHIIIGLDVFGCRTISLYPQSCENGSLWYRIIPRAEITKQQYVCVYQGRSLRDVVNKQDLYAPLFDISEPPPPTMWYREDVACSWMDSEPPRMMRRSTKNVSGITVAFLAGFALDVHFHNNDQASFEVFCRRLRSFRLSVVFRHAPIALDEILVNVGVRTNPTSIALSSACLIVRPNWLHVLRSILTAVVCHLKRVYD